VYGWGSASGALRLWLSLSCGLAVDSVALAGRLRGGTEHAADRRSGHPNFASGDDGLTDAARSGSTLGHDILKRAQRFGVANVGWTNSGNVHSPALLGTDRAG
jgi:hypothetical protein